MHYVSKPIIRKTIPLRNRLEFKKAMRNYDPFGIFLNKFGRRLIGVSNEMDVDPKAIHCALQDYCICKKDSDCAVDEEQVCGKVEDGRRKYSVCKDTKVFENPPLRPYDPYNLSSIFAAIIN
jgi:hypothetical protein